MRACNTALRRAGLVVAGLLVVLAALRPAGAAPAQPSPPRQWSEWSPAWEGAVVPAARSVAKAIQAGPTSPQVMKPLIEAQQALPPEVPRPFICFDMMVDAKSKRLGRPEYAIQRARDALECYEGKTITAGPTPQQPAPESPPLLPPGFPFPPASAQTGEGRTATIKGVTYPCVDLAASPYRVDQWMAQFEQRPNLGPYNCHYYTRTHITTLTSRSQAPRWPEPGFNDQRRRTPDDDCLDEAEMGRLGFVPAPSGRLAVGDIFLVRRRDSVETNCRSTHSAIVIKTTQGRDPILRQKIDPNTCVVDLPLTDFTNVFLSVENPARAWRYDPSASSSREAPGAASPASPTETSCPPGTKVTFLGTYPWCRHQGTRK